MTVKVLASVRDRAEARIALEAGAHVIDLKEPAHGALGAVPLEMVAQVVSDIDGRAKVSTTIGDLALKPDQVREACVQRAATKADFIKIGMFPGDLGRTLEALSPLIVAGTKIIAVLFADGKTPWPEVMPVVARAGFAGIMMDTANKTTGSLLDHMGLMDCERFVQSARDAGLLCGLAGSLRVTDVPDLVKVHPDYLGFRGALCHEGRAGTLSREKTKHLVDTMTLYS